MDYSLPGSSGHGISQARILEWLAVPFSRGSFWTRDQPVSPASAGGFFTTEPPGKPTKQDPYSLANQHRRLGWIKSLPFGGKDE